MHSYDWHQIMKKEKNQNKIIELINLGEKTNKQLQSTLPFTHTTLAKHLKDLTKRREIKKGIRNGEVVYKLSDKGIITLNDISHLSAYLEEIKKRGGEADFDYSRIQLELISSSLPWGISAHLIIDKDLKKLELLTREDVREIEKILFKKLAHNLKRKKLKTKINSGELEIGFNINYSELLKSIDKDSLNYFEIMSDEESKLLFKFDDDPESFTNKDKKQLQKLREKTYEKIKSKKLG